MNGALTNGTAETAGRRGRWLSGGRGVALVVGISLLVGAAARRREVAKLWHGPSLPPTQEIPFAQIKEDPDLFRVQGFVRAEDGFYLEPKTVGQFLFRLQLDPPCHVAVEPVFYNVVGQKRYGNRLSYSLDGGKSWVTAWENRSYLQSQAVVIPPAQAAFVVLGFDAANGTDERALALQGIRLRAGVDPGVAPRLAPVLYALSLGLLLAQLARGAGLVGLPALLAGFAGAVAGALLSVAPLLFGACFVADAAWRRFRKREFSWRTAEIPLLLLILAAGLEFREARLREYAHSPLADDAVGYHQVAQEMRLFSWQDGFYAPRYREPVFPVAVKLFSALFADSDLHQRLLTIYAGIVAIVLTWWVGREAFHPFCGLLAAFLMATDRYLVFRSMYGYRLEVQTALMVLFIYGLFVCQRGKPAWRFGLAGLAGAMLALTELSMLPVVAFFLVWHLIANRKCWRPAILAVATAAIVLGPFFARQSAEHGDPFHPLSQHAKWYRNIEARQNVGKPGWPTAEETHEYAGYGGPPVSLAEYLFGTHSVRQLAAGTSKGYLRYLSGEPFFRAWLPRALFLAGLILVLGWTGRRVLGFVVLIANAPPVMYLYGAGILSEERILLHVFPFAAILVSVPFLWAARALLARVRPESLPQLPTTAPSASLASGNPAL